MKFSNVVERQNDIAELLVLQRKHTLRPSREIPVFDVDPLYRSTISNNKQNEAHSILHQESTESHYLGRSDDRKTEVKTQFGDEELSVEDLTHAEKALVSP